MGLPGGGASTYLDEHTEGGVVSTTIKITTTDDQGVAADEWSQR